MLVTKSLFKTCFPNTFEQQIIFTFMPCISSFPVACHFSWIYLTFRVSMECGTTFILHFVPQCQTDLLSAERLKLLSFVGKTKCETFNCFLVSSYFFLFHAIFAVFLLLILFCVAVLCFVYVTFNFSIPILSMLQL